MLATLQPMQNDTKPPQDYSSFKFHHNRYSPPESPRHLPSLTFQPEGSMNSSHRGLPAPPGFNLSPPDRGPSNIASLGNLPAPPSQWAGHDDSMRNWLQAKAEEDKRRQEEERTKQETLRLDQRKIEQNMLRDSLSGGIPPPMVPLIFAGMGGGNLSNHTLEWAQQYLAQMSIQNQQQHQHIQALQQQNQHHQQPQQQQQLPQQGPPSPELRRDNRMIPPNPYAIQQAPSASSQPPPPPPPPSRGLTHAASNSSLSRLNTAELQPQSLPSSAPTSRHAMHPLQQAQTAQSEPSSGPSLFFHHWTPPTNNGGPPPTPSGKSQQGSPFSQHAPSHLRSEYQNSPKKRKLGGAHYGNSSSTNQQAEPSPPGSSHRDHSPRRSPGHSRQHSDASSREAESRQLARPSSRQQRQEELSGMHQHYRGAGDDRPMR